MSNYDYLGIKRSDQKAYKDKIRDRDNHTCQLCGQLGYIVDHIIPFAISHDSSPANLRVLCHACNLATRRKPKNASPFETMDDYYKYLETELAKYQDCTA